MITLMNNRILVGDIWVWGGVGCQYPFKQKCISLTTNLTSNTICENENVITECSAGKTETANKKNLIFVTNKQC